MQFKITTYLILFTCLVYPLRGKPLPRRGCYECEEEVWEEVPCKSIPSSTTTVAPLPTRPTTRQPTTPRPSPATTPSTTITPEYTTPKDPYKKCYCECKLGCKEFCRKVAVNPSEKQIVQVSKITEPVEKGRIESTHILQRELIPKAEKSYNNKDKYKPSDIEDAVIEDFTTLRSYPLPEEDSFEEDPISEPETYVPYYKKPTNSYKNNYAKPVVYPPIEPVYGPYAVTEASINKKLQQFDAFLARPKQLSYYSPPNLNNNYDFPVPFEKAFSKVTKTILSPSQSVHSISLDDPRGKIARPIVTPYSSSAPVINSPLEPHGPLDQYDDSFDSFLRNVISSDPSNEEPYTNSIYSVAYDR